MASKVYKIIELIGSSPNSFEEAIKNVMDTASEKLTNVRIVEVMKMDTRLENEKIVEYRVRVRVSFKVEREPETL